MNIVTTKMYNGDYMAYDDDTYDPDGSNVYGIGHTEKEAIDDLITLTDMAEHMEDYYREDK